MCDLATEDNIWVIKQSYIKTVNQKQTMWANKFLYSYGARVGRIPIPGLLARKSTNLCLSKRQWEPTFPPPHRETEMRTVYAMPDTSTGRRDRRGLHVLSSPLANRALWLLQGGHFKGQGSQSCTTEASETSSSLCSSIQAPKEPWVASEVFWSSSQGHSPSTRKVLLPAFSMEGSKKDLGKKWGAPAHSYHIIGTEKRIREEE